MEIKLKYNLEPKQRQNLKDMLSFSHIISQDIITDTLGELVFECIYSDKQFIKFKTTFDLGKLIKEMITAIDISLKVKVVDIEMFDTDLYSMEVPKEVRDMFIDKEYVLDFDLSKEYTLI